MNKKNKLVMVEWNDAHAGARWSTLEEVDNFHDPVVVTWVGFLLRDTEKGVSLCFGFDENGNPAGNMFVPRGMIRKIKKVKY